MIAILTICLLFATNAFVTIVQNEKSVKKKIFAVFVCGPDPTQNIQDPNSRNVRAQTYIDLLKSDGLDEEWREYMVYKDHFPSKDEIVLLSGIIITGSKYDSYTNDTDWKWKLQEIIRNVYYNRFQKEIKLFGICFGHQMIIHSLKGDQDAVGRNTKKSKMELGLISVDVTDTFHVFWARFGVEIKRESLMVHKAHNDVVYELPSHLIDAETLAHSKYTDIEMYHIGDGILGIQGHPEFTSNYLSNAIEKNKNYFDLSEDELNGILQTMTLHEANTNEWKYMFRKWLRA